MPIKLNRIAAFAASCIVATAGLALVAPTAQAAHEERAVGYECAKVKVEKVSGKSDRYKVTGTGKCEGQDGAPESGTYENDFTINAKGSEKFWECDKAEASLPAKITATNCKVGTIHE
ncbi:hypothetical protein [Nocardia colli]|uniref:hypothetical protein n=1 Tax=Nocardia colli TaxID=2545717 RepID=UPI0035E31B30